MDTNKMRDLKALAETCLPHQSLRFMSSHGSLYIRNDNGIVFDVHQNRSFPEFMAQNKDYADLVLAANPATILALIAENECVKARLCVCRDCGGQGEVYSGHDSYQGHNQPPEPDMDVCGTCGGDGVLGPLEDFEALAAERDQLKAENKALQAQVATLQSDANSWQSGYSAGRKSLAGHAEQWRKEAHRFNLENEALRRDAERYRFVRNPIGTSSPLAIWNEGKMPLFCGMADAVVDEFMAKEASHG